MVVICYEFIHQWRLPTLTVKHVFPRLTPAEGWTRKATGWGVVEGQAKSIHAGKNSKEKIHVTKGEEKKVHAEGQNPSYINTWRKKKNYRAR